jgi:hypothetical protein
MQETIILKTLGADPEVFLLNREGEFISSEHFIPGDKARPRDLGDGIFVQKDNVMCEFNIPPAESKKDFKDSLSLGLDKVMELLPEGYTISKDSSALFSDEEIMSDQAMIFGCDPDMDAYTRQLQSPPEMPIDAARFCGGHVHLGIEGTLDLEKKAEIVRHLDLYLGVPAVLLDADSDRKNVYGTPGRFRPKKYGVEYRTLSNFWIKNYSDFIYDSCQNAIKKINDSPLTKKESARIRETIFSQNEETAIELCEKYEIKL